MRLISILLRAIPMAVAAILISGCAGSGYLKDLNRYARKAEGPDIASSAATPEAFEDNMKTKVKSVNSAVETDAQNAENVEAGTDKGTLGVPKANALSASSETQTTGVIERHESQASHGTSSPVMTIPSSTEDGIESESTTKFHQSERQPPEMDWTKNSRKDWFFLIMSGLGLIVGLFGQGFGWVVFLIFGGLYLYRKIVRRK